MYSKQEGKSIITERFIRILKSNIYKCLISVSRNMYIDELDKVLN